MNTRSVTVSYGLTGHGDVEQAPAFAIDRDDKEGKPIGGLDAALDQATARGWTVVSMKDDWRTVFPR
jgi:hypothetical protein